MDTETRETLLIVGGKSTAIEIYELVIAHFSHTFNEVVFLVGDEEEQPIFNSANAIRDSELIDFIADKSCRYILSIAHHGLRIRFERQMEKLSVPPVNVIHPTALISPSATLGTGNYLAAGSIVSSHATVGNHCMLNFNVSIGHDARLGDHVVVNPGARISGNVHCGSRVLIGTNSIVFQGKSIGDDCIIDALTYVDRDIEPKKICSSKQELKVFRRVVF